MPTRPRTHRPLPVITPRHLPAGQQKRRSARERGYDTRWDKARRAYLAKHPLCRKCEERGRVTPATIVDHIEPHRLGEALDSGDPERIAKARALFWDSDNWQPLCQPDHDSAKQAEEAAGRRAGRSPA